jgi:hypothetical protein
LNPPTERTWNPTRENAVLMAGEPVEVEPTDQHELHIQTHSMGFQQAVANGADESVLKAFETHLAEHQKYYAMMMATAAAPTNGGGPPPQEQPGLKGYAGNVPNLENAVESEGGIASRTEGAAVPQ